MKSNSNLTQNRILVTGCAGFIGFHLCKRLLENGLIVTGVDNLNNYYDIKLKQSRLEQLGIETRFKEQQRSQKFQFFKQDILNKNALKNLFEKERFRYVIHLAAQAGVRHSLRNPQLYLDNNIQGFFNILESCKVVPPDHLIFASSSSVYGVNKKIPFSTNHNTDHPVSFYALTKKTNELMAYLYSNLYGLPCTGLRFFTVYGPWGRPDMAYFDFTKKILKGETIEIYNNGNLMRDFTYVDDVIDGIYSLIEKPPSKNHSKLPGTPYNLFNIGGSNPISIGDFIQFLEDILCIKAKRKYKCMQPGDVKDTYADIHELSEFTGFNPTTPFKEGLLKFVDWYYAYFRIKNKNRFYK